MHLKPPDSNRLVDALRAYHALSSPLLQRREQREGAAKYLHGLLLEIPRKSIEPMVLALEEQNLQSSRQNSQSSQQIDRSFLSFGNKPFRLKLSRCC